MVILVHDNQSQDINDKFEENVKKEFASLERRKSYIKNLRIGYDAGHLAVLYFGAYIGGLIFFLGLTEFLNILGIFTLTLWILVTIFVMALGILIVLASVFVSRIMRVGATDEEER